MASRGTTCLIPDEESNPELHQLVTKYQYHKCSKYCQRKKRVRSETFITCCRFGFPRKTCETATALFSVEECMKLAHIIMYKMPRSSEEFVAEYIKSGMDTDGNIVYRKLNKPILPNHKLYNPNREEERVFLLFTPSTVCTIS